MIYFILPSYNESDNLGTLLNDISKIFSKEKYKVVVVDDGSTDDTLEKINLLMDKIPIDVISHEKNLGLGCALKSGLLFIANEISNGDVIISMDADNSHSPELAKKMVNNLKHSDIVIASRYRKGAQEIGVGQIRKWGSRIINFILRMFFYNKNVTDYTCGFRAFRAKVLMNLYTNYGQNIITEKGFAATAEMLLKMLRFSPQVCEVPLVLRYDLKKGKSKMNIPRTLVQYLKLIIRNRCGRRN